MVNYCSLTFMRGTVATLASWQRSGLRLSEDYTLILSTGSTNSSLHAAVPLQCFSLSELRDYRDLRLICESNFTIVKYELSSTCISEVNIYRVIAARAWTDS
eukprot:6162222-Pleurochrysis_carterae.AAC.2